MVTRYLPDADIVLAEGFKDSPEDKVEVFRDGPGLEPFFHGDPLRLPRTLALVTDRDGHEAPVPVFSRDDPIHVVGLAKLIEETLLGEGPSRRAGD